MNIWPFFFCLSFFLSVFSFFISFILFLIFWVWVALGNGEFGQRVGSCNMKPLAVGGSIALSFFGGLEKRFRSCMVGNPIWM
jgi:hypothetical protein